MKLIDEFLNNITMYRLVMYFLIVLFGVGFVYSVFGVLPMNPAAYLFSFGFIVFASYIANFVFAKVFDVPANTESVYISALILGLIISPPKNIDDVAFIGWAATLAMASKYILVIKKKHVFNPVAIAVAITSVAIYGSANWWVGNVAILPVVAIGGFLIIRKIKRWDLVLSFLGAAVLSFSISAISKGSDPINLIYRSVINSPIIFFAAIMISEPLTTPPTKYLRIMYGILVGFLFAPQIHFGNVYSTPELALVVGNIFSYIVSPKYKLILKLKEKIQLTPDIYDFIFEPDEQLVFTPGQYMEWTLGHSHVDSRGNRRYLSLASSPTEKEIRLGIKFGNPPGSFKKSLLDMKGDQKIIASQLIGDFTLPKDKNQKLVLIAGGIGITPFRSMIKYMVDKNEKRDVVLVYSAQTKDEFVYKDVITKAQTNLGLKVIFNESSVQGHINSRVLAQHIPDYKERKFFISGSHGVVVAFEDLLRELKVPSAQIVTDYFPGFM